MNTDPIISTQAPAAEPRVGSSGIPLWMVILCFMLVWWAMMYFDQHGGWFNPVVYAPYGNKAALADMQPPTDEFPRALAQKKFEAVCGVCHQPDGMGKPGQFPPLAGSEWATGPANRLIRIPIVGVTGPIKVKGQAWNLSMPGLGTTSDEDLALILSYVRTSWGNKGDLIKPAQVKAARAELGGRSQQFTEPELMKVSDK